MGEPIPMFKVKVSDKAVHMLDQVLASGMIGEGTKVVEFTGKLKERFSAKNLILLNSGTSALTLAGRLIGLEPGDEVITTPFTMIATNVALMPFGVKLVWADINKKNVNISYESIKEKITPRTKAIVAVNVGGIPCELDRICELGIPVISDCAHAVDTYYKGEHISKWADYSCFSFQAIKQLTTADGGAIVIKDDEKATRAEKLKWFGMSRIVPPGMTRLQHQMTADVEEWGYKFHMNDIAAGLGLVNMEVLEDVVSTQIENAEYYLKGLRGIPGLELPEIPRESLPAWWAFSIFVEDRNRVAAELEKRGIITTPMWRRNDEYSVFKHTRNGRLPNMDRLQDRILFIPIGWWVTKSDREYIVESIREIMQ